MQMALGGGQAGLREPMQDHQSRCLLSWGQAARRRFARNSEAQGKWCEWFTVSGPLHCFVHSDGVHHAFKYSGSHSRASFS